MNQNMRAAVTLKTIILAVYRKPDKMIKNLEICK